MSALPVDHIGIAVADLDGEIARYQRDFGAVCALRETVEAQGVTLAFVACGNTEIELLAPTREGTPLERFLRARGPGLHHICFRVSDIVAELARFKGLGHTLIDTLPRPGARGSLIAFLHPKTTGGVLIELCQPASLKP